MLENIEVLYHSTIRFNLKKIIYVDPFRIEKDTYDADIILITHAHFDHFSEEDILKIKNENTKILITKDLKSRTEDLGFKEENIIVVEPNNSYELEKIKITTIPAYNINKQFHPKTNNWVGYLIYIDNTCYYISGDTDITEENKKVKCDVAFVPVGGTYTMTANEAADLVNHISPKIAVPIHYGTIVGSKEDGKEFAKHLNSNISYKLFL